MKLIKYLTILFTILIILGLVIMFLFWADQKIAYIPNDIKYMLTIVYVSAALAAYSINRRII